MPQTIDNLVATWNNAATTFTAFKFNITDTASNAASLLMDLQVGGTSRFNITKAGVVNLTGTQQVGFGSTSNTLDFYAQNNQFVRLTQNEFRLSTGSLAFGLSVTGSDLYLTRRAAANLRLGAADTTGTTAPTAQTLSVQSWTSSTNNNQPGANFTITGSQGTGTGAGGSIIFQVAPAGAVSNGVQNALATALTINSSKQAIFDDGSVSLPSIRGANASSGVYFSGNNTRFAVDGALNAAITGGGISFRAALAIALSGDNLATVDVILARDAANTLALRNGANAQLLRVYARYDGTNDAYGAMGAAVNLDGTAGDANTLYVGSQKKGSPTALTKLAVQVDGTTRLDYNISNANQLFIHGTFQSGGSFFSGGDVRATVTGSIYWNGRTNMTAPADGNLLIGNLAQTDFGRMMFGGTTSSFPALKRNSTALETKLADDSAYAPHAMQYLDVTDGVTAPASATGRARIYVDTADGDLKVIFADGTVKTIVTDT